MKKKYLRICAVALLLALFAFSSKATTQVVMVQNFSFSPTPFTINLGDTVKWVWVNGSHTTTSTTIPAGAAIWDNPLNSTSTSFIYVPTVTGTYNYICSIHPTTMIASFTVTCSTPALTISANGSTTFCSGNSVVLSKSSGGSFTSFQWQKNSANISGETNSSITVTAKGTYTLIGTTSCGSSTSNGIKVIVNKSPKANVTPVGPLTICPPQTVTLTEDATSGATYQWQKNGNNISGATNTTLVVTDKGTYTCTVTKNGCSRTSKKVKVSISCRVEDVEPSSAALVYPNPSSDFMTINLQSFDHPDMITVFDITGKLITTYTVTGTEMRVGETLQPGIYLAKIQKNGEVLQTVKLIKSE